MTDWSWALPPDALGLLTDRLAQRRPTQILEAGSGLSTLTIARHVAEHGGSAVTLEHDQFFHQRTVDLLASEGLDLDVGVRWAPLRYVPAGPWYDTEVPDGIDFVLADGPPEAEGGRAAVLPALLPHLADGWELWLDDAFRPAEQAAVEAWRGEFGVSFERVSRFFVVTP